MICKHCGKENPEEAVFCCYCGKKADEPNHCPACGTVCPDDAAFCFACGTPLKERSAPDARETAEPCEKATKPKTDVIAKVRKAFDLSGGACLMTAVLFAFVFIFCMGLTATASSSYGSTAATSMLWEYFGSAYDDLATMLNSMNSYTSYFEAACYLPVVLSTVVCASSLVLVLVFTIISAVKYGKHFKNPEIKYERYAIAAILSFILGAARRSRGSFSAGSSSAFTSPLRSQESEKSLQKNRRSPALSVLCARSCLRFSLPRLPYRPPRTSSS